MIFKYKYKQNNGKISDRYFDLSTVVNAKLVKVEVPTEDGQTVESEGFILETNLLVQVPIEVPIERPPTKEQKMAGQKAISHSKWELGYSLYQVVVEDPSDVERLKAYYENLT